MKTLWLEKIECTGCGACANICPYEALEIVVDETGHFYPRFNGKCTDCGACEKVCKRRLSEDVRRKEEPDVYAAWSKDEETRFRSTSGGAFSELAKTVLLRNGVVFGAAYVRHCSVAHMTAEDEKSLARLRQSKYVQSDMGLVLREVKSALRQGRPVLFCGTPCQVSGLRAYLGEDHPGLYCIDFICRGVNSPKAYRAWLDQLEEQCGSSVKQVWFKYKEGGWKSSPRRTRIEFENGSCIIQDQRENNYMCGYLESNLYMRPSCTNCKFKGFPRQGNVTLADFWGLECSLDDDKGASMILVNDEKGRKMLKAASDGLIVHRRYLSEIFRGNVCITDSAAANPKSSEFLADLDTMSFEEALARHSREAIAIRLAKGIRSWARKAKRIGEQNPKR